MKLCGILLTIGTGVAFLLGCHGKDEHAASPNPSSQVARAVPAPVTNQYHGVTVVDEFRWLENSADAAVQDWTAAQQVQTRAFFDGLPARALIKDRLTRLLTSMSADYASLSWRRGLLFALKTEPGAQQPLLVTFTSITNRNSERVLLDPSQLPGAQMIIAGYVASPDGRLVAVCLSEIDADEGTLHVYDTTNRQPLDDVIPHIQTGSAGGSVAWDANGTGFFYTRYSRSGERPGTELNDQVQIFFHRLTTPVEQDTFEFGHDFPRLSKVGLKASPSGQEMLASVVGLNGAEQAHYLRDRTGAWRVIAGFEDRVKQTEFGRDPLYIEWGQDHAIYLLSGDQAPRGKILRLPLDATDLAQATVVVPEGKHVIQSFHPAASGLALVLMKGGPSQFGWLDYFDDAVRYADDRAPASVTEVLVAQGDDILFRAESYTEPFEWLQYNSSRTKDRLEPTALAGESPVEFTDVEVVRETVKSRDGTAVPLNIIRKRGTRFNGENPTILSGYGGFGLSQTPAFDVSRRLWLDHGGVFAIANLRGGGEFGEQWRQAGALTNKQNVLDDFAACAEFLVRSRYTRPSRLAMEGRGHGGLLVAAALTRFPDLVHTAVAHDGIYDLLRAELDPSGSRNASELGTVTNPSQFDVLYRYSPYHRIVPKTEYPAVLMVTSVPERQANPAHSRKMVAGLQSATTSQRPILLRQLNARHDPRTESDERLEQLADVYSFLCRQLDVEWSQIDRGPWSGGVTPNSAVVKAKLIREGLGARILVSRSQSLTAPVFLGPLVSEAARGNVVPFVLTNLQPDTPYYYALEIGGLLEQRKVGAFRTFPPPGPASFTMAFSGDARTGSTNDVFDRIREHQPLFFMNVGDLHYLDIRTNDRGRFRAAYDAVLASPQQADLYRQVPFVYIWDDHDFGGNNSNRKSLVHEAARLTYDEYVPHYPLPLAFADKDGGPISQAFSVGRVRFIITDLRSERDDVRKRDNAAKTIIGAKQKAWFKRELLAANGKYPLICWVSSVAWIGTPGAQVYRAVKTNQFGFIHHSQLNSSSTTNRSIGPAVEDWWSMFATERREIADFVKANRIQGLCILHADAHMLAADDGSNSDYATGGGVPIPVMCAAPLDKETSIKGGPYSQGVYRARPGEGCFGLLTVTDLGDRLDVAFSGRNHLNEEKVTLNFTVRASALRAQAP